jgi:phospholipase C
LRETNITSWRRAVCGDLTRAFDFTNPNAEFPTLPSTVGYAAFDRQRHFSYFALPRLAQTKPNQEPGVRPARALLYELFVHGRVLREQRVLRLESVNSGEAGAAFLIYRPASGDAPRTYTVEAKRRLTDELALEQDDSYDYSVYGPRICCRQCI